LLVEVILPSDMESGPDTVARALAQIYDLGIKPDWWKLEPLEDEAAWRNIEAVVTARDPLCRGVVLLGLSAPQEELLAAFQVAARVAVVKGFAVGRTIFYDVARSWLAGKIDDDQAVVALAERFRVLADAWRAARSAVERAA
jgi:5-dehydro-2-deoxygluconokinase